MKIAVIMRGEKETTDHFIEMNGDELQTVLEVFTVFCDANKRKRKARKLLKQFENELQIFTF